MSDSPSYTRLISKLFAKAETESVAEAARWLTHAGYEISQQRLNNWSRRGVPDSACLHIGRLIDSDPVWLFYGITEYNQERHQHVSEPTAQNCPSLVVNNTNSKDEADLLAGFQVSDDVTKGHMLDMARKSLRLFSERSRNKD